MEPLPAAPGEAFALFEDRLGEDGALLFRGPCRPLLCTGPGGVAGFFTELEAAGRRGSWAVLAADYEAGQWFEPRLIPEARPGRLRAWLFPVAERLAPGQAERWLERSVAALPEEERLAGAAEFSDDMDEADYRRAVARIRDYIAAGDCYQVNLTHGLSFRTYGDPLAFYRRLRASQPVRHGGVLRLPGLTALSLSPELFLERRGTRLLSRPMKGTAGRGGTPAEDGRLEAELAGSAKNRAENVMIVDLIRNDLGRLAVPGSVRVDGLCRVEAYPSLFQMVSDVSAEVGEISLLDILRALFPCGSITGAPKLRAMEIIRELEPAARELYTGALGWIAPYGDMSLNVAIRTLVLDGAGGGRMGVGAGIVTDSDPAAEWQECTAKAGFLTGLSPEFRLIETLRLEAGAAEPYPLLRWHLRRLAASSRALGFRYDGEEIRARLLELAARAAHGVHRVRLRLEADGSLALETAPLPAPPAAPVGVALSPHRLDSGQFLLRHKTSARALYDRELAGLPPGLFDLIHLNERGEVCEGARSSVFVRLGGRLYTPPLSCGLLDGVMRRKLLEEGAEEKVLHTDDLAAVETLYLANALRGLMPAHLVDGR